MQSLSQRRPCYKQSQRCQLGSAKPGVRQYPIRSVGNYLKSILDVVVKPQPNYSSSLKHLTEHQLRDIGFTRDPPNWKIPDTDVGLLQSGLHELCRTRIRRLPRG